MLSGGERRRLEIARSLILTPDFLLLDEPFAGIDPIQIIELQELIKAFRNRGMGIIITDHNVREILKITDRSYIIHSGQVIFEGRSEELIADERVKKEYLGRGIQVELNDALRLQLKGSQQLTITPVMHYFIQLLANNHLELVETLQNEVEANPMLEIEPVEKTVPEAETNEYQKRIERADASFMTPYEEHGFFRKNPDDIDKNKALEAMTPSSVSLADHLLEQAMATFSNETRDRNRPPDHLQPGRRRLPEDRDRIHRLAAQHHARGDRARAPPDHPLRSRPAAPASPCQECLLAQVGEEPQKTKNCAC